MPKKTKKQKLRADLIRQRQLLKKRSVDSNTDSTFGQHRAEILNVVVSQVKETPTKKEQLKKDVPAKDEQPSTYQWLINDVKRIVILSLLAFSFEVVVYWAINRATFDF